jgi:hypothetical protein
MVERKRKDEGQKSKDELYDDAMKYTSYETTQVKRA